MITNSLKVLLWGSEIGRLSWDGKHGISYFEYSREFLDGTLPLTGSGKARLDPFPLTASVKSHSSRRPIMGDKETKLYRKLPPFLADSLPDAWGNQVFECWRLENGIRNQEITPLDILSFIGKRGMGALEFLPETSGIKKSETLNLEALTALAQRIFAERENVRILPEESLTMQSLIAVGTSAGGRQPKAIVAIHPETGEIRSGQISGQKGFEYCILKFGDSERSSAELEMAYHNMATSAGIQMMPCWLMDVEEKRHFITRRFDREEDRKLHMQTLAALYPEADSYEKLLMVCRKMHLPESAQEEIFRRMVFNFLANNTDDHNKNFSFLMDESGRWRLAPAYDLTYIFNVGGYLPETIHCLMMRGKFSGWTKDDAISLAKENGIRKAETIIKEVADAVRRFRYFAEKHHALPRWIGAIEQSLVANLNAWGLASIGPGTDSEQNFSLSLAGHELTNVHIERTYKGNFHLLATIDGASRKFVITRNRDDYSFIESTGVLNLSKEYISTLVGKYLL